MILKKAELLNALKTELHVLLHLASKIDAPDYRPSPKQRSTVELMRYLAIMGPIHLRAVLKDSFVMDEWVAAWKTGIPATKDISLEAAIDEIKTHAALFTSLLDNVSDEHLCGEIAMFGHKNSRASMILSLVVSHYAAYRMQLFLYLKATGHDELGTMNLWAGRDPT
jgi:hypothetical protein